MAIETILVNENKPSPLVLALGDLGIETCRTQWQPGPALLDRTSACFVSLYDCISHPLRIYRLRRILRERNIPLVAWNRDAPGYLNKRKWQLDWLEQAQLIDIYLSHALPDERRFAGTQALLHNAAQVENYNLNGATLAQLDRSDHYLYDVSFFGAIDSSRHKEYQKRQKFFSRLASVLIDQGISFNFIDTLRTPLSIAQQISLVQTSRINLNFDAGCEYGSPVGYGLPERCFGIPACGGFLLSDARRHAQDAFDPVSEWAEFRDDGELLTKITHYLSHFDEARAIARQAHVRVMRDHTYRQRALQAVELIENWRESWQKLASRQGQLPFRNVREP